MYRPTPAEVKHARGLTRELTPSKETHAAYVEDAKFFLGIVDLVPFVEHMGKTLRLETIRWQKSLLFSREYLVAHVDDEALGEVAPGCDAIATMTSSIPLVLVPLRRRGARSEAFISILEHEIVHVNQMLLGAATTRARSGTVAGAIKGFFNNVRLEYQANLLQLTKSPRLFPSKYELTLEQWCALRGWTDTLEFAVCGVFCAPSLMESFLARLPRVTRPNFASFGVSHAVADWLTERHLVFVRTALKLRKEQQPELLRNDAFLRAAQWCMRQEEIAHRS